MGERSDLRIRGVSLGKNGEVGVNGMYVWMALTLAPTEAAAIPKSAAAANDEKMGLMQKRVVCVYIYIYICCLSTSEEDG